MRQFMWAKLGLAKKLKSAANRTDLCFCSCFGGWRVATRRVDARGGHQFYTFVHSAYIWCWQNALVCQTCLGAAGEWPFGGYCVRHPNSIELLNFSSYFYTNCNGKNIFRNYCKRTY
jgi:hypothetical protein